MSESEALIILLNHLHEPELIPKQVWKVVAPVFEREPTASIERQIARLTREQSDSPKSLSTV